MSYRIVIEKPAKLEIDEAAVWIGQASPERAVVWYFDLERALESLRNFPARCPLAPESRTFKSEIRHLISGTYRILFRIEDETVRILYFRHTARKPLGPDDDDDDDDDDEETGDEV